MVNGKNLDEFVSGDEASCMQNLLTKCDQMLPADHCMLCVRSTNAPLVLSICLGISI